MLGNKLYFLSGYCGCVDKIIKGDIQVMITFLYTLSYSLFIVLYDIFQQFLLCCLVIYLFISMNLTN
jgi:hypothetical protein